MQGTKGSELDCFGKLGDTKEKCRIDSAFKIIFNLHRQKRQNEADFSDNFQYALQRLVSGLGSDRIAARKGFFTGLVQVLKTFPDEVSVSKVVELMNKHLHVEEAEFISGRFLCLGAILRSGRAKVEELGDICKKLVEISTKKSYLSVAAIKFIVDYFPHISKQDFATHVWPFIEDKIRPVGDGAKIEAFWLLLEINSAYPELPPKNYVQDHFRRNKLISEVLPQEIAEVLMVRIFLILQNYLKNLSYFCYFLRMDLQS